MCTVSMVGDHYRDIWKQRDWYQPHFPMTPAIPMPGPNQTIVVQPPSISRAEFDELKREVTEMKALLKRAKEYDERNGEPNCEMDEKMAILRKVAELVGVKLDDVLGKPGA